MGSRLAVRIAVSIPLTTPTRPRIVVAIRIIFGATINRMSPSLRLHHHRTVKGQRSTDAKKQTHALCNVPLYASSPTTQDAYISSESTVYSHGADALERPTDAVANDF